jgi:peptidoglycan/LPS O-acetylase OafA/YrhL
MPFQVMVTAVQTPDTRRRFEEIDVLRGLAALCVVLSHYYPHWDKYLGPIPVVVRNSWGWYAVKLFFVISGFVIFMTLDRCRSVAEFAVLRFSRLYPAYWATFLFVTIVSVGIFGDVFWLRGFVANATMFQEFLGVEHHDVVYWSLSVELAFYIHAAWLFALGLHRHVRPIVAVWLLCACAWALALPEPVTDADQRDWFAKLFAFDYAPYFAIGMVLFDVTKHGWSGARIALIGFAIVTETLIAHWRGLLVALACAALFVLAVSGRLRFLVWRPTLWLGAISYSLYLVHRNLGYKALDWLHAHGIDVTIAVPLTIAGALVLATLFAYGVERPASSAIRAWYRRRSASCPTGSLHRSPGEPPSAL